MTFAWGKKLFVRDQRVGKKHIILKMEHAVFKMANGNNFFFFTRVFFFFQYSEKDSAVAAETERLQSNCQKLKDQVTGQKKELEATRVSISL